MTKADEFFTSIDTVASAQTERKTPTQNNSQGQSGAAPTSFYKDPSIQSEEIESEEKPVEAVATVLTEKQIEDSGKAGAFLAGSSLETAFGLIERVVFINRFSREDKERLMMMDENNLSAADESLNRKFLAFSAKHEKIKAKIPLNQKEMEALAFAYAEKARITQKVVDPQLIVWTTISKIFIGRSMDIFL